MGASRAGQYTRMRGLYRRQNRGKHGFVGVCLECIAHLHVLLQDVYILPVYLARVMTRATKPNPQPRRTVPTCPSQSPLLHVAISQPATLFLGTVRNVVSLHPCPTQIVYHWRELKSLHWATTLPLEQCWEGTGGMRNSLPLAKLAMRTLIVVNCGIYE